MPDINEDNDATPINTSRPFTIYNSLKNDDLILFSMIDSQTSSSAALDESDFKTFSVVSNNSQDSLFNDDKMSIFSSQATITKNVDALAINEEDNNSNSTEKNATDSTTSTNNNKKSSKKLISSNYSNNSKKKRPYSSIESDDNNNGNNNSRRKGDSALPTCGHPKHDEYAKVVGKIYKGHPKKTTTKFIGLPKRLEACLNIDRGTLMCTRCILQTDKDSEKYISPRSIKKRGELVRLKIDMNF
nr:9679_t:CDS:2 [Entrophospora candida]